MKKGFDFAMLLFEKHSGFHGEFPGMMAKRARVLVVEEDLEASAFLARDLAAQGFDVTTAAGSGPAENAVRRCRFDAAVLGPQAEGGAGLLDTLRKVDPAMAVLSAAGSLDAAGGLIRRGAYACVARPYNLVEIRALLDSAVHSRTRLYGCLTLYEISRALLATLKQGDLVRLVVELADRVMSADGIGLMLTGRATKLGKGIEFHSSLRAMNLSQVTLADMAGQATAAGQVLPVPSDEEPLRPGQEDPRISSALAYSLSSADVAHGALMFFRGSGSPAFSQIEIDRGGVVAGQVSLALENARLYRELEDKMAELVRDQDKTKLRERLALVTSVGSVLAHEVNNPLAALSCNLDALKTYSSDLWPVWEAAKAAAEFLVQQAEPTGLRLSKNIVSAAGTQQRTDLLVTEVVAAIDECLDGVRRIAELVRGLYNPSILADPSEPEPVLLCEVITECLDATGTRDGRRPVGRDGADAEIVAMVSKKDLVTAVQHLVRALDRLSGSDRKARITIGAAMRGDRPSIIITDPSLDYSPASLKNPLEPGLVVLGHRVALDCALAVAWQLLERNGAEIVIEAKEKNNTRLCLVFRPTTWVRK